MRSLPVVCALMFAWTAQAQPLPASPPASTPLPAESAMSERVRREASNPMRIILEAAKIRRKPGEGDGAAPPVPAPAPPPVARRPAARSGPVAEPAAPTTPARAPEVAPQRAPAVAVSQPAASVPDATPPAAGAAPVALAPAAGMPSTAAAQDRAASGAAGLPGSVDVAPTAEANPARAVLPAAPGSREPAPAATPVALKVLSMVPPEIPNSVLRRVGTFNELTVQLTVQRDGSVSNVSVPAQAYRAVEPYVVDALTQWRFEPVAEPVTRRLQLVFNN